MHRARAREERSGVGVEWSQSGVQSGGTAGGVEKGGEHTERNKHNN